MKRKYMSGAQKKKLATQKKERQSNELTKTRKINELFSGISLTAADQSSAIEAKLTTIDEPQGNVDENSTCESEFNRNIANVSTSTSLDEVETNSSPKEFSADAGLWNIQADKLSLQNYWMNKGSSIEFVKY